MTGRRVIAALGAVALVTAVVPPAAAWAVNRRRVGHAEADVRAIAERLRDVRTDMSVLGDVLRGPGREPRAETEDARLWVETPRRASLAPVLARTTSLSADPWGNSYLVKVGVAGRPATIWILSAGPNGIIDTPFLTAAGAAPAGDDVGVAIR